MRFLPTVNRPPRLAACVRPDARAFGQALRPAAVLGSRHRRRSGTEGDQARSSAAPASRPCDAAARPFAAHPDDSACLSHSCQWFTEGTVHFPYHPSWPAFVAGRFFWCILRTTTYRDRHPAMATRIVMPGKVNPMIPEVVNEIAYKVISNDVTITLAARPGSASSVRSHLRAQLAAFDTLRTRLPRVERLLKRCAACSLRWAAI